MKSCKFGAPSLLLIILAVVPVAAEPSQWKGLPLPTSSSSLSIEAFHYRMRGSVKLLFIWVGKDNVGGGTICRISNTDNSSREKINGYSVLFGSDPGSVPGNHNRWGYARELAWWNPGSREEPLSKTVFEGFMSKSSEESVDEISWDENRQNEDELSLFEGSIGIVNPEQAGHHLWRFNASSQATYRTPEIISSAYLEACRNTGPDVERALENKPPQYDHPAGFFTAIKMLMDPVLEEIDSGSQLSHFKNASRRYVNSAHLYTLKITKAKVHEKFEVDNYSIQDVLQLDFQTLRHDLDRKHTFSLWIPTSGKYRGIPVKIADKPRWWLKVELKMDFEEEDIGTEIGDVRLPK